MEFFVVWSYSWWKRNIHTCAKLFEEEIEKMKDPVRICKILGISVHRAAYKDFSKI